MDIRTLRDDDFEAVFTAFNRAFSDYIVPLTLQREQLREMMVRRGYRPEASAAAFDGESIVAFVLNGLDRDRAYNTGTGVIPGSRRRGLSREILEMTMPVLREMGAATYLLEVLETNTPAFRLYETSGFRETRRLQCWSLPFEERAAALPRQREVLWDQWSGWWEFEPSWQNASASIERAREPFVAIGNESGYAIVFPAAADLAQLAVAPASRRNGIGRQLLNAASALARRPLRILNIDDRHHGIAAFLQSVGATRSVRQIEMAREI